MARGTNYPSMSLPEAIERVRKLYEEAHRRKLSREEIAKHLGYTGLNGRSVALISNLTKYGLLDGRGEEIRVSDDAVLILVEEQGAPDRAAAIRRAAFRPELFRELADQFAGGPVPSENAIKIRLEKMGYPPQVARDVAGAYRENTQLVESEGSEYNESTGETFEDEPEEAMPQTITPEAASLAKTSLVPASTRQATSETSNAPHYPVMGGGVLWWHIPFKGTPLSVRIETQERMLTREHIARIRAYLQMVEEDMPSGGVAVVPREEREDIEE